MFLRWLEAEDLDVGNFLQLQRQMDAAVQYGFGPAGEARHGAYSIRPGHESRSHFYGHINLLGGREMVRPLSVGPVLANTDGGVPVSLHSVRSRPQSRRDGGVCAFQWQRVHSTLLMDLALGRIDFIEVFQFGVLKSEQWYELLNAGFQVTGVAGSDFPVPLGNSKDWPRWHPSARPGADAGEGARRRIAIRRLGGRCAQRQCGVEQRPAAGNAGGQKDRAATASASFFRPLEKLEIVSNGEVIAAVAGDGKMKLTASARVASLESCWVAARVVARRIRPSRIFRRIPIPFIYSAVGSP